MLKFETKNKKYDLTFMSKTKVSKTKRQNLKEKLINYVENDKSSDLVEIVENVRNILSALDEEFLSIVYADLSNSYIQSVIYVSGKLISFSSLIGNEPRKVEVATVFGNLRVITDYKFDDEVKDVNELNAMHNIIDSFTKKYFKLKEMELKKEEKVKRK